MLHRMWEMFGPESFERHRKETKEVIDFSWYLVLENIVDLSALNVDAKTYNDVEE